MERTNEGVAIAVFDANGVDRSPRVRLVSRCAAGAVFDNIDYARELGEIARLWTTAIGAALERRCKITAGSIDCDLGGAFEITPERGVDPSIDIASVYEVAHV